MTLIDDTPPKVAREFQPHEVNRFERALKFMRANFRRGPTLAQLATVAGLSPWHFSRQFKAWYGKTPKRVLTELQVDEAKRLLLAGKRPVEIASLCGFSHQAHMTQRFRLVVGKTPARWRRDEVRGKNA